MRVLRRRDDGRKGGMEVCALGVAYLILGGGKDGDGAVDLFRGVGECDERLSRKECCEWVITLYCVWCGGCGRDGAIVETL